MTAKAGTDRSASTGSPASTRELLLRAALAVIAEHGVAGLTNRLVATRAAVSLGSLTYHFPSQTELLREAMVRFATDETGRIKDLVQSLAQTVHTVPDAATAAQKALSEWVIGRDEIAQIEMFLQAARDPELHDASLRCYAAYDEVAAAILARLGVRDAKTLAPQVVALISGAHLRRLATGEDNSDAVVAGLLLLAGVPTTG
ncbi:MAG: TetR family transcriptional regulator [Jatrophihabitantaceae bacterium]